MGLEEGNPETTNKLRGKSGVSGHTDEEFEKSKIGSLYGGQCSKPFLFLGVPQAQPLIELIPGNGKALTEAFHGRTAGKVLGQDAQKKEQPISRIRNDEIRKDGMGSAAVADQAQDDQITFDRRSIYEINNPSAIVGVDMAIPFYATAGTGFQFRTERSHVGIKEDF